MFEGKSTTYTGILCPTLCWSPIFIQRIASQRMLRKPNVGSKKRGYYNYSYSWSGKFIFQIWAQNMSKMFFLRVYWNSGVEIVILLKVSPDLDLKLFLWKSGFILRTVLFWAIILQTGRCVLMHSGLSLGRFLISSRNALSPKRENCRKSKYVFQIVTCFEYKFQLELLMQVPKQSDVGIRLGSEKHEFVKQIRKGLKWK